MWLLLAFCSAALLGFYDVFKKKIIGKQCGSSGTGTEHAVFESDFFTVYFSFVLSSGGVAGYAFLRAFSRLGGA